MTYQELEDHLVFFDKASKDYEKFSRGRTEEEQEKAGFVSGHLYETHEILKYALSDSRENFESITKFFASSIGISNPILTISDASSIDSSTKLFSFSFPFKISIASNTSREFPTDVPRGIFISLIIV